VELKEDGPGDTCDKRKKGSFLFSDWREAIEKKTDKNHSHTRERKAQG